MKDKKIALYIRVSTLDQAREGYSLEAQERTLRKWCNVHEYEIYDIYADRGISGKDIKHRTEMRRLLQDAKEGKFNAVIFWALSRFTRSVLDLYSTMELLRNHNIDMISYTESFDTSSSMGRAMIGIVGIFAQLECELTGERVSLAMSERAAQGKRTSNSVLGYDIIGKDSYVINNEEAKYVQFCFESYLECKNLSYVAQTCKERGYTGKRGKSPTAYAITKIIMNPIYCGYNSFKNEVYKGYHEPIVTVEIFNKVQRLLKAQGKMSGRKRKRPLIEIV